MRINIRDYTYVNVRSSYGEMIEMVSLFFLKNVACLKRDRTAFSRRHYTFARERSIAATSKIRADVFLRTDKLDVQRYFASFRFSDRRLRGFAQGGAAKRAILLLGRDSFRTSARRTDGEIAPIAYNRGKLSSTRRDTIIEFAILTSFGFPSRRFQGHGAWGS